MNTKMFYVSLPISGYDLDERMRYAANTEKRLIDDFYHRKGIFLDEDSIQIVTPFTVCPEKDMPYTFYIGRGIQAMLECDAIYMCQGWQNSDGCMLVFAAVKIYKKKIFFE